jgi:hypothetical protein
MFAESQEIAGGTCAGTQHRLTFCDLIPLEVHSSRQTQSVETDPYGFGTSIKVSDCDIGEDIVKYPKSQQLAWF